MMPDPITEALESIVRRGRSGDRVGTMADHVDAIRVMIRDGHPVTRGTLTIEIEHGATCGNCAYRGGHKSGARDAGKQVTGKVCELPHRLRPHQPYGFRQDIKTWWPGCAYWSSIDEGRTERP